MVVVVVDAVVAAAVAAATMFVIVASSAIASAELSKLISSLLLLLPLQLKITSAASCHVGAWHRAICCRSVSAAAGVYAALLLFLRK